MEIVKPHVTVVDNINGEEIIKKLNRSARKCYQSNPNGPDFHLVQNIIRAGHTSVLEHVSITFDVVTDRAVANELVRHRIASYSQESTRYVKYNKSMEFIKPIEFNECTVVYDIWKAACEDSEKRYIQLLDGGCTAQEARSVLNNSLKTEIRVT